MKDNNMSIELPKTTVTVNDLMQVLVKVISIRAILGDDFGVITFEMRDSSNQPIVRVSLNCIFNDLIFTRHQGNMPLDVVFKDMYKNKLAHPVMDKLFRHCILFCETYDQVINRISIMNEHIEKVQQQISRVVGSDVTICEKQDPNVLIKFTYTSFDGNIINGHVSNSGLIVLGNGKVFLGIENPFSKAVLMSALREGGYYGDQDVLIINGQKDTNTSKNDVHSVYALINHPTLHGVYLSVSSKDDPGNFRLPGGQISSDVEHYGKFVLQSVFNETGYRTWLTGATIDTSTLETINRAITYYGRLEDPEDIYRNVTPGDATDIAVVQWSPVSELAKTSFGKQHKTMFDYILSITRRSSNL